MKKKIYYQEESSLVLLVVKKKKKKKKILTLNAGDVRDVGLVLGYGISPGGRNENLFQYSCLKNPMDREAWWVIVHEIAKSQKQPKQQHAHAHTHTHTHKTKNTLPTGLSFIFKTRKGEENSAPPNQ